MRAAMRCHFAHMAESADEVHVVEQILGELLSNVQRYAPGPFCAELHALNDTLHFSIHDCGPGFDTNDMGCIMTANEEAERGRGIAIIKASGGTIQSTSAVDGGCRVSVTLPIHPRAGADLSTTACPHDHPALRCEHCPRILAFVHT